MSAPTRMSPEDSAFWRMESEISRMHSVTLATFSGPPPELDELIEYIARRVPLVPRFRQRVVEVPFDLGRPMWVDDPDFALDNHITAASLAGGLVGMSELVSLIVSEPLDRTRPLWELTVVTGLPDGGWALISKVHHSMIDGLFGTEPLAVLVDGAVTDPPAPSGWQPARAPHSAEIFGRTVAELMFNPAEQYRFFKARARQSRRRFDTLSGRLPRIGPADPTGLRGPVGGSRTWSSLSVEMESIRLARRRFGANTHELVLALVTTGLRDLLMARDEAGERWPTVKAIVPMAVAGSTAGFHGGIAAEVVVLPTAEAELADRIRRLHEQTPRAAANPVAIDAQIGVAGFPAPALASLGLREATRRGVAEREAHTVVVNVPGPREELTVLGHSMIAVYSVPPLAANTRLSVGVFSYLDELTFGVTADRESMPDVHVVTTGIRRALAELTETNGETDNADS